MSFALAKIDTTTSIGELQNMARLAGQIGISKTEMVGFVQAVDMASVALGDEFSGGAEEVVTVLGKLRTVFKDTKGLKADEAIRRIGSAINELGAAGTATGGNISDFASRIARTVPQMSAKNALAFGAALEQVGINSEIASGGLGKLFLVASQNSKDWAKQLVVTKKQFSEIISKDPVKFMELLAKKTKNMTEIQVAEWLDAMKVGTQESIGVVNALKNNGELS